YNVVQLDDVIGAHPDTSVTRSRTDFPFLRRSVHIDISGKRVCVLRFAPAQPKNARHDRIAAGRIWHDNFTGAASVLEHGARGRVVADFFGHFQFAEWSGTAPCPIAQAEL